jgi:hypothetical protein
VRHHVFIVNQCPLHKHTWRRLSLRSLLSLDHWLIVAFTIRSEFSWAPWAFCFVTFSFNEPSNKERKEEDTVSVPVLKRCSACSKCKMHKLSQSKESDPALSISHRLFFPTGWFEALRGGPTRVCGVLKVPIFVQKHKSLLSLPEFISGNIMRSSPLFRKSTLDSRWNV